jgi:hypothetical protein
MAQQLDPLKIHARLYNQIGRVLDELEDKKCDLSIRERIAALALLIRYDNLMEEDDDRGVAGSAVRGYASAFQQNAAGGGAAGSRRRAAAGSKSARNHRAEPEDDDAA